MVSRRIRICVCFLSLLILLGAVPGYCADAASELPFDVDALSAVLMDAETSSRSP